MQNSLEFPIFYFPPCGYFPYQKLFSKSHWFFISSIVRAVSISNSLLASRSYGLCTVPCGDPREICALNKSFDLMVILFFPDFIVNTFHYFMLWKHHVFEELPTGHIGPAFLHSFNSLVMDNWTFEGCEAISWFPRLTPSNDLPGIWIVCPLSFLFIFIKVQWGIP